MAKLRYFFNLMKAIIDGYILNGDDKDEYSILPDDFIDLESKTITWHSDTEKENKLQLKLEEKEIIISITRDKNSNDRTSCNAIKVRIRTDGSSYEHYYQEFERFFSELSSFAYQVESVNKRDVPTNEPQLAFQKKLSLLDKLKK